MKTFLVKLVVATALLLPNFVLSADLPGLIPVVSKSVDKDKAIDLVKNGGPELRVPQETLIKKLGEIIAKHRGHNLGGEEPLSKEEVVKVLEESEVVPCAFNKGDVSVYGFHRNDTSKGEGFYRDSRPSEMCLEYKGARVISLFCLNPLMDLKVKLPPPPPSAPVSPPVRATTPPPPAIPPAPPVIVVEPPKPVTTRCCVPRCVVRCCNPCCNYGPGYGQNGGYVRGTWGSTYYR